MAWRKRLVAVLASGAAMMVAPGLAESPRSWPQEAQAPPGRVLFRATTTLIQFDAQVFDAGGRPVVSLTRDSFEVLQDGVPVPLKNVTFISRQTVQGRAGATGGETAPQPPLEPLVFLIDDMAMTSEGFRRVREGLRGFVARGLPAGVEMGILRTGETGWRTTTLSADPGVLLTRIGEMRYLARSYRRGGLASGSGASGPDGRGVERPFTEGTLGSLASLLANLRRLPGRKVVVLLSEGVALDAGAGENAGPSVEDRMNRLGQLAALAGVTTHSMNVAGVQGERTGLEEGLVSIAEKLGGRYFYGRNDLTGALGRLAAMEEGYYLLTYEPPPGTFVLKQPPPFRRLTVRVRGKNLDVRTRRGFFGGDYR